MIGTWLCKLARMRGGNHKFVNGRCVRCNRKQPTKRVKV